jgi:hypothetical protein
MAVCAWRYGIAEDYKATCAQVTYGISRSSQKSKEIKLRSYGVATKHLVIFGSYDAVETKDEFQKVDTCYNDFEIAIRKERDHYT